MLSLETPTRRSRKAFSTSDSGNALESFKLQIANDRQLFNFENNIDAATRAFFSQDASSRLIKKAERQNCLQIALDLLFVVRIAGTGLDVVKDVVFSETTIAGDVD